MPENPFSQQKRSWASGAGQVELGKWSWTNSHAISKLHMSSSKERERQSKFV